MHVSTYYVEVYEDEGEVQVRANGGPRLFSGKSVEEALKNLGWAIDCGYRETHQQERTREENR